MVRVSNCVIFWLQASKHSSWWRVALWAAFIIFSAAGGCFVLCLAFAKACRNSLMMTWDDRMMSFLLPSTSIRFVGTSKNRSLFAWDSTLPTVSLSKDQAFFCLCTEYKQCIHANDRNFEEHVNLSMQAQMPNYFIFSWDGINRQKIPSPEGMFRVKPCLSVLLSPVPCRTPWHRRFLKIQKASNIFKKWS